MKLLRRLRRMLGLAAVGLSLAAISQELAKPRAQRTWNGRVLGFVPYDFRIPTPARIRRSYWNPRSRRLFTPRVLGVGWTLNLHRARELARQAYSTASERRSGGRLAA